MRFKFANIRCAIDVLRGRLPGALAMLKAEDIAISVHHHDGRNNHWCRVEFFFRNPTEAGNAYRAVERLYKMSRPQQDALAGRPTYTTGMSEGGVG